MQRKPRHIIAVIGFSATIAMAGWAATTFLGPIAAEETGHEEHEHEKGEHKERRHAEQEGQDEHEGEGAVELTAQQMKTAGIRVGMTRKQPISDVLNLTGEIQANGDRLVHVSPRAGGIVLEVRKTLGDDVKAGETLAILDSAEVGEAALEYLTAKNALDLAKVDLDRIRLIVTNTRKMLAILKKEKDPEKVAHQLKGLKIGEAKAELLESLAEIEVAKPTYEKQKKLFDWQKTIYEATGQMLKALNGVTGSEDAARKIVGLRVGEAKARVLEALTARELAQVSLGKAEKLFQYREPIYRNTLQMLTVFRDGITASDARGRIKGLNVGDAKKDLIEALASVELAKANYKRQQQLLKENVGSERAMQEAQKDLDAAASAYDSLLEQVRLTAQQDYLEARQEYLNAKQEYLSAQTTYPALLEQIGVSSEAEFFETEKELLQALGEWVKARSAYSARMEQVAFDADMAILNAEKGLLLTEHQLKIAEDKLHVLGLSHKEIDRIASNEHERITNLPITAPFDGRIIARHVVLGEKVEPDGDPLYAIADLSDVWVQVDIYERDLAKVHLGAKAQILTTAYPEKPLEGTLTYISDQLMVDSRSAKGRVVVSNDDRRLKPGMFARVAVMLDTGEEVLAVPVSAVQRQGNADIVFVQEGEENRFVQRSIRTGRRNRQLVEVLNGLKAGERVVVEGAFTIKSEMMKGAFEAHAH